MNTLTRQVSAPYGATITCRVWPQGSALSMPAGDMLDGGALAGRVSDAALNSSCGATWFSVHHSGGVGIGYSCHAGMVVVADGAREADDRFERVLTGGSGPVVVRHADAGCAEVIAAVARAQIDMPMGTPGGAVR
jgi:urocanate hydratase